MSKLGRRAEQCRQGLGLVDPSECIEVLAEVPVQTAREQTNKRGIVLLETQQSNGLDKSVVKQGQLSGQRNSGMLRSEIQPRKDPCTLECIRRDAFKRNKLEDKLVVGRQAVLEAMVDTNETLNAAMQHGRDRWQSERRIGLLESSQVVEEVVERIEGSSQQQRQRGASNTVIGSWQAIGESGRRRTLDLEIGDRSGR
jgi:hypothetical protein